jgi:hypothetical protein
MFPTRRSLFTPALFGLDRVVLRSIRLRCLCRIAMAALMVEGAIYSAAGQTPALQKPAAAPQPAAKVESIKESKAALAKWMQSQQIISKELAEWSTARDIFNDRIELTKGQLEAIEEKLKGVEEEISKADTTKVAAIKRKEELLAATETLRTELPAMEEQVKERHRFLPVPFQDKVAPIFQRIPADPATTKISLAERYQNVIGILNEVNKLHNEITVVSEIRLLDDGKPTEVQTIYLGLAQAYYLSMKGDAAGVGKPGEKGWEWTPRNELAKPLKDVLAVMNAKTKPRFIPLPASVQ